MIKVTSSGEEGTEMALASYPLAALAIVYVSERRRTRQITAGTARDQSYILRAFAAGVPDDPRRITRNHVEAFATDERFAPSTLRTRLSTLRGFAAWLVVRGHIRRDPTIGIASPAAADPLPRRLRRDESGAIVDGLPQIDVRRRLMVQLAYGDAMRRIEVARLQITDVDRHAGVAEVRGKRRGGLGLVTRAVPLAPQTLATLDEYLRDESSLLGVRMTAGPLFRNRHRPSRPLDAGWVGKLIVATLYELGVKQAAHDGRAPHALRHTALTEALEGGARLEQVQRWAGHDDPGTTHRYTLGAVLDLAGVHTARSNGPLTAAAHRITVTP